MDEPRPRGLTKPIPVSQSITLTDLANGNALAVVDGKLQSVSSAQQAAAFRTVVAGTRALYVRPPRFVPRPLAPVTKGTNGELFKIVARAERWHHRHGRLSMPEVAPPEPATR